MRAALVVRNVRVVSQVQTVRSMHGVGRVRMGHVRPSRLSSSGAAPGTMRRRSSSIRAITVVW